MNSGVFCLLEALKAQCLVAVWDGAVRTKRFTEAFSSPKEKEEDFILMNFGLNETKLFRGV